MSNKNIPRLMIVYGDDNLTVESSLDEYLESIEGAHGECVVEHFDPSAEHIDSFMSRAMTASLFGDIRLFCVLHAQAMADKDLELLGKSLDFEIPDVYVYISAAIEKKGAAKTKLDKALQLKKRAADPSVYIREVSKPYDNKLAEWIIARASEKFKRKIAKPEAQLLAESVEYNLIDSELKKIDMALPPGAPIDRGAILNIVGVTRAMTVYELAESLGKRDLVKALQALDSLFAGDFYAPLVASAVFRHFWSMLKIRNFLEKKPEVLRQYHGGYNSQSGAAFEIGVACGILGEKDNVKSAYPKIILSGVVDQSQKFTSSGLTQILKLLQQYDVGVKTGGIEPTPYNLQMLCYKIVRTR